MLVIGIDTGVNTGFATWCTKEKRIIEMTCLMIHQALQRVQLLSDDIKLVIVEDARLRKGYYGENSEAKKQGAGSIKRDASIWEAALNDWDIPFLLVAPSKGTTFKGSQGTKRFNRMFKNVPKGRTNEHVRDAVALCYGK